MQTNEDRIAVVCDVLEELGPKYEFLRTLIAKDAVTEATKLIEAMMAGGYVADRAEPDDYVTDYACIFCGIYMESYGNVAGNPGSHQAECPYRLFRMKFDPAFAEVERMIAEETAARAAKAEAELPLRRERARRAALIRGAKDRAGLRGHGSIYTGRSGPCSCARCAQVIAEVDARLAAEKAKST